MRLLHTSSIQLFEFMCTNIPLYAILSHTWEREEVTFHDLQFSRDRAEKMEGFIKISKSCEIARQHGFSYLWIDTCCIDKSSSAELSEAINSMYGYYQDSQMCITYLGDVPSTDSPKRQCSAFRRSRWFTRGWTLQELLAPLSLVFYCREWVDIGTKSSLKLIISEVTGVPSEVLLNRHPGTISIAIRMSWAAKRETTRAEDMAYCLMGIFDVHMPAIYGEGGTNAFRRLQEEIIRYSDDQSIFAWRTHREYEPRGLFARSPSEFSNSGEVQISDELEGEAQSPYAMTNIGLRIELPLVDTGDGREDPMSRLAILKCRYRGASLGIYLGHVKGNHFVRMAPERLVLWYPAPEHIPHLLPPTEIYVKERDASMSKWNRHLSFEPAKLRFIRLPSLQDFLMFEKESERTRSIRAVLLRRRNEFFTVFVGAQEHVWVHISAGDADHVQELAMLYPSQDDLGLMPSAAYNEIKRLRLWDELSDLAVHERSGLSDRAEKVLQFPVRKVVSVSMRAIWKGPPGPDPDHHIAQIGLSLEPTFGGLFRPPLGYDFLVDWTQAYAITLRKVHPKSEYLRTKASMYISSSHDSEPTFFVFDHKETGGTLIVALGLTENSEIWANVTALPPYAVEDDVWKRKYTWSNPQSYAKLSASLKIGKDTVMVSTGRKDYLEDGPYLWAEIIAYGPLFGDGERAGKLEYEADSVEQHDSGELLQISVEPPTESHDEEEIGTPHDQFINHLRPYLAPIPLKHEEGNDFGTGSESDEVLKDGTESEEIEIFVESPIESESLNQSDEGEKDWRRSM